MTTDFSNKVTILAELWMNYRDDDELRDFMEYNDLGLPMAYLLMNELVLPTEKSELYINETFDLILCNILAKPLCEMAPQLKYHLNPKGTAILSGLLNTQSQEVIEHHQMCGLQLEGRISIGEWETLILRNA